MAVKYRQEFYSTNDTRYRISIDDATLGSDSNLSFDVDRNLFNLSYQGQSDERFQTVITSRCNIGLMVNSTDLEDLIEDMVNSEDGRFKVLIEIYEKGTLSFEKFWFGNIITDQVSYEDKSYPFVFNITAIDQLGTLSEINYNDDGTTYTGSETIIEHLINILSKTDQNYFHNSTDIFLTTINNWYEDSHVYNSGENDPLILTRIDHIAFYSEDEDGNTEYFNCLDVLKELARVFGARIYQSGGSIRFEQVNEREDSDFYAFEYDKTGVQQSEGLNSTSTITTDKTISKTHLAGGVFSFLPGLKYVRLEYNHQSNRNLLFNKSWNNVSFNDLAVGEIASDTTTTILNFSANVYVNLDVNAIGTDLYRIEFDLKLIYGSNYLKRTITDNNYGSIIESAITWEATSNNFVVSSERFGLNIQSLNIPLNFQTPVLPTAVEDVTFGFTGLRYFKNAVEELPTDTPITINNWELQTPILELYEDGNPSSVNRTRTYQVNNDFYGGNTQTKELNNFIGDALTFVTRGKMEVFNGSTWADSDLWSVSQSGTTRSIMELMIFERLAGQKRGTLKYNGSFQITNFAFYKRIVYAGDNILMMGGSFSAKNDSWNGSFFKLTLDRTNMSFSTETTSGGSNTTSPPSGSGNSSGSSNVVTFTPPIPEFFDNHIGATITGISGTLPPNSLANQYLEVFRDGRKIKHTTDYTIDEGNNEIDLVLQGMGENFEIKIY